MSPSIQTLSALGWALCRLGKEGGITIPARCLSAREAVIPTSRRVLSGTASKTGIKHYCEIVPGTRVVALAMRHTPRSFGAVPSQAS